jgi:hypothetical protein
VTVNTLRRAVNKEGLLRRPATLDENIRSCNESCVLVKTTGISEKDYRETAQIPKFGREVESEQSPICPASKNQSGMLLVSCPCSAFAWWIKLRFGELSHGAL